MPYITTVSPPTEGGASSPPQVYKCRWLASSTLEVEEDMKKIMSMELPLVLLSLMLLSLATCVLGQGTGSCDPCDCSDVCDRIRFTDPSRNYSAGQIQVCFINCWQTVCLAIDPQQQIDRFSDADANVACFQLSFFSGYVSKNLGLACKLVHLQSYLVVDTPCKGWEEKLSNCNLQPDTSEICTHQTAVSVTCEREPLVNMYLPIAYSIVYSVWIMHHYIRRVIYTHTYAHTTKEDGEGRCAVCN